MKHLVVGAGASFAEARSLGFRPEDCPPLIRDFARKMWAEYLPSPFLELYLATLPVDPGVDPRAAFLEAEAAGIADIEQFMEFAWGLKDLKQPDDSAAPGSGFTYWQNFVYHGIAQPLVTIIVRCFYRDGRELQDLRLTSSAAEWVMPGDLVMSLNYDTVFELALRQSKRAFEYAPKVTDDILVCKPHGSINMVVTGESIAFGDPEWPGTPQPVGTKSYVGLIPPKINKTYARHPIAQMLLDSVRDRKPEVIALWGVGLADGDTGLREVYSAWGENAKEVEIINPSRQVVDRAKEIFACPIKHFETVEAWLASESHVR